MKGFPLSIETEPERKMLVKKQCRVASQYSLVINIAIVIVVVPTNSATNLPLIMV